MIWQVKSPPLARPFLPRLRVDPGLVYESTPTAYAHSLRSPMRVHSDRLCAFAPIAYARSLRSPMRVRSDRLCAFAPIAYARSLRSPMRVRSDRLCAKIIFAHRRTLFCVEGASLGTKEQNFRNDRIIINVISCITWTIPNRSPGDFAWHGRTKCVPRLLTPT
jgi:hypothetical protein